MKNTIYKLFTLFALIVFSCTTDSISNEEFNALEEKLIIEDISSSNNNPKPISNDNGTSQNQRDANSTLNNSSNQRTGFGDGDGNIYDGDNTNDSPDGYEFNYTVTFNQEITEAQKRALRIPYQIAGELLYFEQCPNNPQKEIWYMVFNTTTTDCSTITFPDGSQVQSCPLISASYNGNPPRGNTALRNVSTVNMLPINSQNNCN